MRTVLTALLLAGAANALHARTRLYQMRGEQLAARRAAVAARLPPDFPEPPAQVVTQLRDHFNPQDNATFRQRWWANSTLWVPGGPVFLYIEGEAAGNAYDVLGGEHVELAAHFGALLVSLEHRYYGASYPTPDISTASLRWLTSHQALADLAVFLTDTLAPAYGLNGTNKVVVFGGSYAGALSAWARLRLPHLIHASLSTSGPLSTTVAFGGYNDVVGRAIGTPLVGGSPACRAAVGAAFAAFDAAMGGTPAARHAFAARWNSCNNLDDPMNLVEAAWSYADYLQGLVQYNEPGEASSIGALCANLTAPGVDPVAAYYAAFQAWLGPYCSDNDYESYVQYLRNDTIDPTQWLGERQWTYQTCAQMGNFQYCDPASGQCPFSSYMNLSVPVGVCADVFGLAPADTLARAAFERSWMGSTGLAGSGTSRIVFVNGQIDPWSAAGLTASADPRLPSIYIAGTSHCRNMDPSRPDDPPALVEARGYILGNMTAFLAED